MVQICSVLGHIDLEHDLLAMFNAPEPVVSMEPSGYWSVGLVCKKPGESTFRVLDLEIPRSRTDQRFKSTRGSLTVDGLLDAKPLFGKSITILSREGAGKVTIYKTDPMVPLTWIYTKIDGGRLAVDYTTNTLIIWGKKNACVSGSVYDIELRKKTLSFINESNTPTCNYSPYFMAKNELMVLNSENGSFDMYDLTSGKHIENITLPEDYLEWFSNKNYTKWFSNTMYSSVKYTTTFNLTLISNSGALLTYDLRNRKKPYFFKAHLFKECNNDISINYDPSDPLKRVVCGFDTNVYVIDKLEQGKVDYLQKSTRKIYDFKNYSSKVTSSALWLPMCGRNTLLSAASNEIQKWQYQ